MRPSPISRRQPQTQNTEPKDLSSRPAELNNTTKRTAHLAGLAKVNTYNDSVNRVSQGRGKRRSLGSFKPQKRTVQSEIAPDHGLGVGDNMEKVISSLLYPESPAQVSNPLIDVGSQPKVSNAPDEESICLNFSEYLIPDDKADQPENLDIEMNMGNQEKDLSEISLDNFFITNLLEPSSDLGDPAHVSQDFSLDFLDALASQYKNDPPESQDAEMNFEGELDVNHAALSVNDFQAVEENTSLKRKSGRRVLWTPTLIKIAQELIQENAYADPKLSGKKLLALLKEKCDAHNPKLVCPGYKSFLKNFLEQSYDTPVRWTDELREIAQELIQANSHADRKLNGTELHARLEEKCDAHNPQLVCPNYESFRQNFLKKSYETPVRWTDELREIAQELIQANSHADRKLNGTELHARLKERCDAHNPKLVCPGYPSFRNTFLVEQSRGTPVRWTDELIKIAQELIQENAHADPNLSGRTLHARLKEKCDAHDPKLVCPGYPSFYKKFLTKAVSPT